MFPGWLHYPTAAPSIGTVASVNGSFGCEEHATGMDADASRSDNRG